MGKKGVPKRIFLIGYRSELLLRIEYDIAYENLYGHTTDGNNPTLNGVIIVAAYNKNVAFEGTHLQN